MGKLSPEAQGNVDFARTHSQGFFRAVSKAFGETNEARMKNIALVGAAICLVVTGGSQI